jgi:hypothetical protein
MVPQPMHTFGRCRGGWTPRPSRSTANVRNSCSIAASPILRRHCKWRVQGPELIITIRGQLKVAPNDLKRLWLADIHADATAAVRILQPLENAPEFLIRTAAVFQPKDYSVDAIAELKTGPRGALLDAGLFADEADAVLKTWELSYSKSPVLRLFSCRRCGRTLGCR